MSKNNTDTVYQYIHTVQYMYVLERCMCCGGIQCVACLFSFVSVLMLA